MSLNSQNRPPTAKIKATPKDGFGNDFGNKCAVSLQTLVTPIDLAEEVSAIPIRIYWSVGRF